MEAVINLDVKNKALLDETAAKELVVLGAGESGIGAALLAGKNGYKVFVSDGGLIKDQYKKELIENEIEFE